MLRSKLRWLYRGDDLDIELKQLKAEGINISGFKKIVSKISSMEDGPEKEAAASDFYNRLVCLKPIKEYIYDEPSNLKDIQAASLSKETIKFTKPDKNELWKKIKGAWLGRCAGCLVGIPVETWERKKIKAFLSDTGNLPIKNYLSSDIGKSLRLKYEIQDKDLNEPYGRETVSWINNVHGCPVDDDINYTVLSLKILEKFGIDFSPENVAATWITSIPVFHACTAERVAYRNILNGVFPPGSASFRNPYREWIGAQIRGDMFGYINPGDPSKAAELAFRDASVSHVKNGIYGEMWVAAMLAVASCCENLETIVRAGMGEIPRQSRLHEGLSQVLKLWNTGADFESVIRSVHEQYDESDWYDWCHTIPNAMIVCSSILYSDKNFDKAIDNAITSGFDTDCNGATVGSIIGMIIGVSGISHKWLKPLKEEISSTVDGYYKCNINDLVDRTVRLIDFR